MSADLPLNYHHLHYFWVVAKEGGISRAAERLGVAVQTVSAQVRELERALGTVLLEPAGRGVALTEAGRTALQQADAIFQLGEALPGRVRDSATHPVTRLTLGVADGLPKLIVHRLLQPLLGEPALRLTCHENAFEALLADLALHRLDMVLADRASAISPTLKVYSHALGESGLAWYASSAWLSKAQRHFPRSLAHVPVLLPTEQSAVRLRIDQWFERHEITPRIVGQFEDSALLKTFGAGGMGVFPASELVEAELREMYRVKRVGPCEGVTEQLYLIGAERKIKHPLVQRLLSAHQ